MANPSLQIGNGKFAIKENDLLGYSSSGTRFFPIPITMTRATLGSRVNPSGLIEDVELLGSEEVENGDGSSTTGWDLAYANTTLSINNNNLRATANGSGAYGLSQDLSLDTNKQYIIKATINVDNASGGAANLRIATNSNLSSNVTTLSSTTGTTTTILSPSATTMYIGIVDTANDSSNYVEIDNISVKEYTIDGLARVDYTDGTASLLVEPQRTNLITYSESISNLSSTTNGTGTLTITDNYTDSPQGLQNASRVQMSIVDTNDTNNYRLINAGSVMITGVTREISFYAKSLTGSNQDVLVYWSYDQQIVTLTNDWQRFKISATSGNSSKVFIGTRGGSGSYFSGGDANLDFALWGLQVEDDGSGGGSSYATSYIKTQGSSVTRNKDQYEKTGISDKINSEEGVLFLEMSALADDGTSRCISIFQNGSNFIKFIYSATSNRVDYVAFSGGNVSCNITNVISNTTINTKFALKWKVNDFALWINGTEVGTDSSGDTPLGMDKMNFTDEGGSGNKFFGKIKQLQVFKTALSDSELATLTTL